MDKGVGEGWIFPGLELGHPTSALCSWFAGLWTHIGLIYCCLPWFLGLQVWIGLTCPVSLCLQLTQGSPTSINMRANFSVCTSVCISILLALFLWRLLADTSCYIRIIRALCWMKGGKNQILNNSLFDDSIYNTFLNDKILETANRWWLSEVRPGWKGWMLGCEHKEIGGGRCLWW